MDRLARLMAEYLPTAPDAHWLYAACDSNSDSNGELIRWMTDQPSCPQAAALAVYWSLRPAYYERFMRIEEVPDSQRGAFVLVQRIRERYLAGFYRAGTLGFDPRNDPTPIGDLNEPGFDWVAEDENARSIPEAMKAAVPGLKSNVQRPEGWDEGLPPQIRALVLDEAFQDD